jgi:hypothetical protein
MPARQAAAPRLPNLPLPELLMIDEAHHAVEAEEKLRGAA